MTFKIMDGSASDIRRIMPVMAKAFDPNFGETWNADQLAGALCLPGTRLAFALEEGQPLGFALWRTIYEEAELLLIGVDPDHHRKGVGKALYVTATEQIKDFGANRLHVEVRADNPALYFYAALGFAQVGSRPNYYRRTDGGPTSAVTLSMQL